MSAELWEKVLCKHCDVVGSSQPAAWTTADFIGKVDEATKTDPDRAPHVSARRPFVSFARNGFLRVGGPLDLAIVADAEQAFVDKDESRPLRHRRFGSTTVRKPGCLPLVNVAAAPRHDWPGVGLQSCRFHCPPNRRFRHVRCFSDLGQRCKRILAEMCPHSSFAGTQEEVGVAWPCGMEAALYRASWTNSGVLAPCQAQLEGVGPGWLVAPFSKKIFFLKSRNLADSKNNSFHTGGQNLLSQVAVRATLDRTLAFLPFAVVKMKRLGLFFVGMNTVYVNLFPLSCLCRTNNRNTSRISFF